uniref:Putative capsid protein n=1 Tax=viral metagenome TaxID=1070528 RepID=A0A6H1ZFY0_9ZZZZ
MQRKYFRNAVYPIIANYEEVKGLKKGDTLNRPYRNTLTVKTVGTDGAITRQTITDTNEALSIATKKEVTFYIEAYDEIQTNYATRNLYADDAGMALKLYIDGDVLGEYDQAASTVDDGDLGGTDALGFTLTVDNILSVFGKARKKLDRLNIPESDRWAILSPEFCDVLYQYLAGKESTLGDSTGQNGNIGKYGGFTLYKSNGLGWSASLLMGDIATENDTLVIAGVTFTFKATCTTAGDIDIKTTAATQATAITTAFNNTTGYAAEVGAAATYFEVTADNRTLLEGIVASVSSATVSFKGEGVGWVAVSETFTEDTSVFTTALEIQHNLFGQGRPIDLVIQKYPTVQPQVRSGYIGKDIINWILLGIKTFIEGTKQIVDVQVRSESF